MKQNDTSFEKNLSPVQVGALAVGCIIGWGAFMLPGETFLRKAGPLGTALAMGLSCLIMMVIAYNYNFMVNRFPVTGGAFAFTKIAFGEKHSFVCSWFLGLSYLSIIPLNGTATTLLSRILFRNAFQVGGHYTVAGYDVYLGEILLAAAILILFACLSSRGVGFTGTFQTALVVSLVLGVLIFFGAAVGSDKASLANLTPLFSPSTAPAAGTLSIVAIAPWAFAGYETIPQAVEEFRFSPKKTMGIMGISLALGAAVYAVLNTVTAMTVPAGYDSWVAYVEAVPQLDGLATLPTFNAAYILLGKAGLVCLGVAVMAAILSSIIGFYMATSRLLYSMAKEHVLPDWFGYIHPKGKTPSHAIYFAMLVSLAALPLGRTALEWIVNMSSVGAAIGACYTCASSFKFARMDGRRGVVLMSLLGLAFSLLFLVLLLVPLPGSQAALNKPSFLCLLVWILLGLLFYRQSHRRS